MDRPRGVEQQRRRRPRWGRRLRMRVPALHRFCRQWPASYVTPPGPGATGPPGSARPGLVPGVSRSAISGCRRPTATLRSTAAARAAAAAAARSAASSAGKSSSSAVSHPAATSAGVTDPVIGSPHRGGRCQVGHRCAGLGDAGFPTGDVLLVGDRPDSVGRGVAGLVHGPGGQLNQLRGNVFPVLGGGCARVGRGLGEQRRGRGRAAVPGIAAVR